jgi:hypothetical protein
MKFKLDENLGPSIQLLFREHGHDCVTTREEGLGGAVDPKVLQVAVAEGRILVTNDHDFGNVLLYPPEDTTGIAVLNPPGRVSLLEPILKHKTSITAIDYNDEFKAILPSPLPSPRGRGDFWDRLLMLRRLTMVLLDALACEDIHKKLWIVEPGRIREHQSNRERDLE